jgi:hypothetical protein
VLWYNYTNLYSNINRCNEFTKYKESREKMRGFLTKIMMLVVVLFFITPFSMKVKAANAEGLEVKTDIGYNNSNAFKPNFYAPATISIKNGYKDINGTVEVRVPVNDNKYESYTKSLSIQKGSEKSVNISVPIKSNSATYKVVISDGNKEIYSEDKAIYQRFNQASKFIGILSDDFESVTYLTALPQIGGATYSNEIIKLDEKNFSEDSDVLAAFDIILINNFDSTKLNKSQYENLKLWVSNGGTLIIGTGTNGAKSLGVFKDNFIVGSKSELKKIKTSQINSIGTNGDNNNLVDIEILNMNIEGSSSVLSEGNTKLLQVIKKGKGVVGVAGFDLGLAPFAGWNNNSAFGAKMYVLVNSNLVSSAQNTYNGRPNEDDAARNMLSNFLKLSAPKTNIFYIIVIIYILLVAPISYMILKKIDKRELMWITVPVLSIVFAGAVYISGNGTRLSKITTNMINVVKLDKDGLASGKTYVGIDTPKKMNITVQVKEGERTQTFSSDYYNSSNQNDTKMMELETKVRQDKGTIEFYNKSIFQPRTMKILGNNPQIGKIDSLIRLKDNKIIGNIKNSTTLDLTECYLITANEYFSLGPIKSGDSITVPESLGNYNGDINNLIQSKLINFNNSNGQNYNDLNQKSNMILVALGGYGSKPYLTTGATLIGLSDNEYRKPITINGKEAEKIEKTIVTANLSLDLKNGDTVEYPFGLVPSEILPGSTLKYDSYTNAIVGSGSAEVVYHLDKALSLEEFQFDMNYLNKSNASNITVSIYNTNKKDFETASTAKTSGEEVKNYLESDNSIKLKISINNNSGIVGIPLLSAKGKVK